jgi:hypothetical protein
VTRCLGMEFVVLGVAFRIQHDDVVEDPSSWSARTTMAPHATSSGTLAGSVAPSWPSPADLHQPRGWRYGTGSSLTSPPAPAAIQSQETAMANHSTDGPRIHTAKDDPRCRCPHEPIPPTTQVVGSPGRRTISGTQPSGGMGENPPRGRGVCQPGVRGLPAIVRLGQQRPEGQRGCHVCSPSTSVVTSSPRLRRQHGHHSLAELLWISSGVLVHRKGWRRSFQP